MMFVREVHYRTYTVSADSEHEAKLLVEDRDADDSASVKDIGVLEFSHEEDKMLWVVDETRSSMSRRKAIPG